MRKLIAFSIALFITLALPLKALSATDDTHRQANHAANYQLEAILSELSAQPIQFGHYQQIKQIAGFSQPLVSSGNYRIELDNGVVWQQTFPFDDLLVIKGSKLYGLQVADSPATVDALVVQDVPSLVASMMAEIFTAMLSGDIAILERSFDLALSEEEQASEYNDNWSIALTPKSAPLNAIFATIILQGSAQSLAEITMKELSGDSTVVRLTPSLDENDPNLAHWLFTPDVSESL